MPAVADSPVKVNQSEVLAQYSQAEAPRVEAELHQEADVARKLFDLPAEFYGLTSIVICSVWPERMVSQYFTHGGVGRKTYTIEAGSAERPSYLSLQNTFDMVIQQAGQEREYSPRPIPAAAYGNDIIRFWTGDHPANKRGKKGIGIIKGRLNQSSGKIEATPEEITELVRLQNGYLDYLVERADNFWDRGEREKIGNEHRKALRMRNQDINQHPWYRSRVQAYNDCPYCAEKVQMDAIFCKTCHKDIVQYFVERNVVPDGALWPRVVKEMERITK